VSAVDPVEWLRETVQLGDLVLTGCRDLLSRLIQSGTGGRVSHVAIGRGDGRLVEAYDYGLNPDEHSEGVFATDLEHFIERSPNLQRLVVRRPHGLDRALLAEALTSVVENSPPFPTTGAGLTSVLVYASRPSVQRVLETVVGAGRLDSAYGRLVRIVANGPLRCHCSETATRLYVAAGFNLRFVEPVLIGHLHRVAATRNGGPYVAEVDDEARADLVRFDLHPGRRAEPTALPTIELHKGVRIALGSALGITADLSGALVQSLRDRQATVSDHRPDIADLIVPADFERAEPFDTVGVLRKRRGEWSTGHVL
jgi:hypothetical protein